jgi:uncharacterized protein (TIGR03086 family)
MDLVAALDQTFAHAHGVIANVRPDQYDNRTPCTEWTVRDLLEHMVGVVTGIGGAAAGTPPQSGGAFELSDDPAGQFEAAAKASVAAWDADGVMDQIVDGGAGPMPGRILAGINLLDTATHTWDLATATGQPAALPDDVAAAALEVSGQIVSPEIRTGRFDAELPASPDATTTERLVAFLGRKA